MYRDLKLLSVDESRYNNLKQNLRSYYYMLRNNNKQAKQCYTTMNIFSLLKLS